MLEKKKTQKQPSNGSQYLSRPFQVEVLHYEQALTTMMQIDGNHQKEKAYNQGDKWRKDLLEKGSQIKNSGYTSSSSPECMKKKDTTLP